MTTWPLDDNDRYMDCVVGDTMVSGIPSAHAFRSRYSGEIAIICLASGRKLAVTSNHGVLSERGFIAAKCLKHGDNLVCASGTQIFPWGVLGGEKFNVYNSPAPIKEKFSPYNIGISLFREAVPTSVDFHGDAKFFKGNVDIIASDSFLRGENPSSLRDPHPKHKICAASHLEGSLQGFSPPFQRSVRSFSSALRNICPNSKCALLVSRQFGVAKPLGLKKRPELVPRRNNRSFDLSPINSRFVRNSFEAFPGDVSLNEFRKISVSAGHPERVGGAVRSGLKANLFHPSDDGRATDSQLPGNFFERYPSFIKFDRVINIERQFFCGHVFDLSNDWGWYFANGVVSHNCFFVSAAHIIQYRLGLILSEAVVTKAWEEATGSDPADGIDEPTPELAGLRWWQRKHIGGIGLKGWNVLDITDSTALSKQADNGGFLACLALPTNHLSDPVWNEWDGPRSNHFMLIHTASGSGLIGPTWGADKTMTWDFWASCAVTAVDPKLIRVKP